MSSIDAGDAIDAIDAIDAGSRGSLVLDLPAGWSALDLLDHSGRRVAAEHLADRLPDAARRAAAPRIEALLHAGADWLLLPPAGRPALGMAVVRPPSGADGGGPGSCARRQRRLVVDERLILVDDLAVIQAPAADVVLAVCECTSDRSAHAAGGDASARPAADELIDAMGVLG